MAFHTTMLIVLAVFSHGVEANCQGGIKFNTAVFFGDSRSDTGNMYKATNSQWPGPPYYNGRFSNGPNWVDYFNVSNKINYAYAGATSDSSLSQGYVGPQNIQSPGVRQQISMYFNNTNTTTIDFQCTLYVIWVGADDYFYNPTLVQNPATVAVSLRDQVAGLIAMGAQHILIFNEEPLELVPMVRAENLTVYMHAVTIEQNSFLSNFLSALQSEYSGVSIQIFDAYSLISSIVDQNLLDNADPCWIITNYVVVSQCNNPNSYLFIDNFHFTTGIHNMIANKVYQFLSSGSLRFVPYSFLAQFIFIIISLFIYN